MLGVITMALKWRVQIYCLWGGNLSRVAGKGSLMVAQPHQELATHPTDGAVIRPNQHSAPSHEYQGTSWCARFTNPQQWCHVHLGCHTCGDGYEVSGGVPLAHGMSVAEASLLPFVLIRLGGFFELGISAFASALCAQTSATECMAASSCRSSVN